MSKNLLVKLRNKIFGVNAVLEAINELKNETSVSKEINNTKIEEKIKTDGLDLLLVCAFNLWQQREADQKLDLVIVTDNKERYSLKQCERILAPWKDWINIMAHHIYDVSISNHFWSSLALPSGTTVLGVMENMSITKDLASICQTRENDLILPILPSVDTFENDMIREVFHWDFEYGAKNDWDGTPVKFSTPTLQLLSSKSCQDYYPAWGFEGWSCEHKPWRVMDIGCGPISVLRWGVLQGMMSITGVDPLLDMYALILAKHGYDSLPCIRCDVEIPSFAEKLEDLVPDESYDVIFTRNALDHTQDPERVIANIGQKLSPKGRVILQVATREGTRQNWDQFHKTDIYLNNSELVYCHENSLEKPLLSPSCKLSLVKVQSYTPEWLSVILEKS